MTRRRIKLGVAAAFVVSFVFAACEDVLNTEDPDPTTTTSSTTSTVIPDTTTTTAVPVTTTTTTVPPTTETHVVTHVVDGDTVDVSGVGRVRLIGIDTPEVYGGTECYGPEASARAKALVEGHRVRVELDDSQGTHDRWGRVLAYLWIADDDGAMLNEVLVAEGYAEEYRYDQPYRYIREFTLAEMRAAEAGLGLWGAC